MRWIDPEARYGAALSSDGRTLYKVTRNGIAYTCDCAAGQHGRACRHVAALKALLVDEPPAQPFRCAQCGQDPALGGEIRCRRCLEARAYALLSNRQLPVDLVDNEGNDDAFAEETGEYREALDSLIARQPHPGPLRVGEFRMLAGPVYGLGE